MRFKAGIVNNFKNSLQLVRDKRLNKPVVMNNIVKISSGNLALFGIDIIFCRFRLPSTSKIRYRLANTLDGSKKFRYSLWKINLSPGRYRLKRWPVEVKVLQSIRIFFQIWQCNHLLFCRFCITWTIIFQLIYPYRASYVASHPDYPGETLSRQRTKSSCIFLFPCLAVLSRV